MNLQPVWKTVFYKSSSEWIDDYYLTLGEEFCELYRTLNLNEPIKVVLSEAQEESLHESLPKDSIGRLTSTSQQL